MNEDIYYTNSIEKRYLIQFDIFNNKKNIIKVEKIIENNSTTLGGCGFLLNSFGEIVYSLFDRPKNQFYLNKIPNSNISYPDCQNLINPYNKFFDLIFPF